MKRDEMLRKLKPDYQGNLTIEDVILKINFVSKFRFIYALVGILNLITFIINVRHLPVKSDSRVSNWHVQMCVHFLSRDLDTALAYQKFDSCFLAVSYILYFIAYLIYGIRLLTILPPSLRPRMKIVRNFRCHLDTFDTWLRSWFCWVSMPCQDSWISYFSCLLLSELLEPVQVSAPSMWVLQRCRWHRLTYGSTCTVGLLSLGSALSAL